VNLATPLGQANTLALHESRERTQAPTLAFVLTTLVNLRSMRKPIDSWPARRPILRTAYRRTPLVVGLD
jgi:hypothetical protein